MSLPLIEAFGVLDGFFDTRGGISRASPGARMATFDFFGESIEVPAVVIEPVRSDPEAWLGGRYLTLKLTADVEAVRVHTNGRSFSDRPATPISGRWFAIGDIIQTATQYRITRALPGPFTGVAWAILHRGSILNVGRCGPLFESIGGGFQAEFVSGPSASILPVANKWHAATGRA